jgi:epoxyqueuosine reductase
MPATSSILNTEQLTSDLKEEAKGLGFPLIGVCPAFTPDDTIRRLRQWLAAGYAGQMSYIPERLPAYADPNRVLDGARSVVLLAFPYRTAEPEPTQPGQGRIARYAWGEADYHDVLHQRLKQLAAWLRERAPQAKVRGVVDSAPIMEREFAQLAGLGWIGKHTLLLNRTWGSYFFLAALLTDLELTCDEPFVADHCGTCRACLDACPTDAFPSPYVLDATRCISYLTIELRESIPEPLRVGMGDWLFGCDICQEVCPWNRRTEEMPQALRAPFEPRADANPLELLPLFDLSDEEFRMRFRRTPLWRAKRRGILRNAAIALGNQRLHQALPLLKHAALREDPLVSEACQWAINQIETNQPDKE